MPLLHLVEKLRIVELHLRGLLLVVIELIEYGHQHQGDHHPDCNTLKIVHSNSLIGAPPG
jgi:hypothetical protein